MNDYTLHNCQEKLAVRILTKSLHTSLGVYRVVGRQALLKVNSVKIKTCVLYSSKV